MNSFSIIVPASSANVGPGFDSVGTSVNRYLTLLVENSDGWEFINDSPYLPRDVHYKDHYIYKIASDTARKFGAELPPCKVTIKSEIPLARGLGSSASAIVAGIELASRLCGLKLSHEDILNEGTRIEGHPDNIAPAVLGGLIISIVNDDGKVDFVRLNDLELDLLVYIPQVELKTSDARNVLPDSYSRAGATRASSISNLMIASLMQKDYKLAGKMMESDMFHEPFRADMIPNYELIREHADKYGAYGTVISGAGPTMISFVDKGMGDIVKGKMQAILDDYQIDVLDIDASGLHTEY